MEEDGGVDRFDLAASEAIAVEAARQWGLERGLPFALSAVSFVAPAGDAVPKVASPGNGESLHEPDALELWDGTGAVRLLRQSGRALLEERAVPGDDLAALPNEDATGSPSTGSQAVAPRASSISTGHA